MTNATQWLEFQLEDKELNHIRELLKAPGHLKPKEIPLDYRRLFFRQDKLFFDENDILMKKTVSDGLEYNLVVLPRAKMS